MQDLTFSSRLPPTSFFPLSYWCRMLFLLVALSLSRNSIQGAPISTPLPLNIEHSTLLMSCECPDLRSIWNILWSCLATIFACSWVSIHPNIPRHGEKQFRTALRRVELMAWSIIGPEFILMWAMRQWRGAKILAEEYSEYGWTTTHGYYLQMGGFMLYNTEGETPIGVLSHENFRDLLKKQKVRMPAISKSDIEDRSKSDGLSKAFVVIQTAWFIAQCIARKAKGLEITEFELVTVSFAALNGVMYFLWWNKPLDVHSTVPVYLLRETENTESVIKKFGQIFSISEVARDVRPTPPPSTVNTDNPDQFSTYGKESSDPFPQHRPVLRHYLSQAWRVITLIVFQWPVTAIVKVLTRLNDMSPISDDTPFVDGQMQVGTFYAHSFVVRDESRYSNVHLSAAAAVTGILFGGIHCAGWFFHFPSHIEETLWRICSIIITVAPAAVLVSYPVAAVLHIFFKTKQEIHAAIDSVGTLVASLFLLPLFLLICSITVLYIVARITLLIIALNAFKDTPPNAYLEIDWISFLPHI